jgi:hypothetical protein
MTNEAKEEEGKLMVDDEDKKEALDYDVIWKTMHMAGGPIAWVLIVISFFITSGYSKWVNYETRAIFTNSP